jgi:DNA-directed RNA polymerase subunit beta (EC 2.7.7.6)
VSIDEERLAKIRKDIDDEFGIIDGDIFRRIRFKTFWQCINQSGW